MHEAYERLLSILNQDIMDIICNDYSIDINLGEEVVLKKVMEHRDEIYEKYFSFIKPYFNNPDFIKLFDFSDESSLYYIFCTKFLIGDELYHRFLDIVLEKKDFDYTQLYIMDMGDYDIFKKHGISDEKILNVNILSSEIIEKLYGDHPNISKDIMFKNASAAVNIGVKLFLQGDMDILNYYNSEGDLLSFLYALSEYRMDAKTIIEVLASKMESNRIIFGKSISIVKDMTVAKKIINNWGSLALVLIDNPSKEVVELANDFSIEDYIKYDGSFKDSSELLLKFLNNGENIALFNTHEKAIDTRVIEVIRKRKISIDDIKASDFLLNNIYIQKYLVENGVYDFINNIIHIDSIETLDYLIELFNNNVYSKLNLNLFSYSSEQLLFYYIMSHDFKKINLYNFDMPKEVIDKLIDLGFKFEDYMNYVTAYSSSISKCFYEKGHSEALFFIYDDSYVKNYIESVTYDDYLKAKSLLNDKKNMNTLLIAKLLNDGHYDVLDGIYYDSYSLIKYLGLMDVTYEDYLKLPEVIKNIPELKEKFVEEEGYPLEELLEKVPNDRLVRKALIEGIDPNYLLNICNTKYVLLSLETTIEFIKRGYIDALYRCKREFSDDEELIADELIELYYNSSKGQIPSIDFYDKLGLKFLSFYLKKGRYDIFTSNNVLSDRMIEIIFNCGYSFETFKQYPLYDGEIIASFINEENEEYIYNFINKDGISLSQKEKLFYKYIDLGLNKEHLFKLSNRYRIYNFKPLFERYKGKEKEVLELVDRYYLYRDINVRDVDKILEWLTPEQLVYDLKHADINEKIRVLIIRKMVLMGHYEFVQHYRYLFDDEILKTAILNGFVDFRSNTNYLNHLRNIKFSDDELNVLRSKIVEYPLLFVFLPEIVNNTDLLGYRILKYPESAPFFNEYISKNMDILEKFVALKPEFVVPYLNDLSCEELNKLLKVNKQLLDFIPKNLISIKLVALACLHTPNIIDKMDISDNDIIVEALKSGYVFNDNTSSLVFATAILNGISIPIEILAKNMPKAFEVACEIILINDMNDDLYIKFFGRLFEYLLKYNEDDFYFYGSKSFCFNEHKFNDEKKKLFIKMGLYDSNYNAYDFQIKEKFILKRFIKEKNISINEIDLLEEMIDRNEDKYNLFSYILEYFSGYYNLEKYKNFSRRIAKKYFLDDPLSYGKYVDKDDPEIINMAISIIDEYPKIYELIPKVLNSKEIVLKLYNNGCDPYSLLDGDLKDDLDIIEKALLASDDNINRVNSNNPKVRDYLISNFDKFIFVFEIYPEVLNTKERILKALEYKNGKAYKVISDEFKRDYDICMKYIKVLPSNIGYVDKSIPRYGEMVVEAIKLDHSLFASYGNVLNEFYTQELYELVLNEIENAFDYLPERLQTIENFKLVKDKSMISYNSLPIEKILEIVNSGSLNINEDLDAMEKIFKVIFLDKSFIPTEYSEGMLELISSSKIFLETNDELFKKLLELKDSFDYSIFGDEICKVFLNAKEVLDSTGKINTLEKNPVFSFGVCRYIYPEFGLDFVNDLIKYNTPAAQVIIKEIKEGNIDLLKKYYDFIRKNNVFKGDDKLVHFAFRNFEFIKKLLKNILDNQEELTSEDIANINNIIANKNYYHIDTLEELKEYKKIVDKKAKEMLDVDDINIIKSYICQLLGMDLELLKKQFEGFQVDNFEKISYIRNIIIEKMGEEKAKEVLDKYLYTKKDVKLILFLKRIIYSDNIDEIKSLIKTNMFNEENGIEFGSDFSLIIDKIRQMYNLEFNLMLTKPELIKSPRQDRNDPNNTYGVSIIKMDGEEFRFLAHRLFNYDTNMSGFARKLMDNPALWTQLEGASTLSTSSFSDKGFWFLNADNPDGVVYLFSDLPESFMLFMYGRDLYVEHGGYKLEPTSNGNSFSDIDALNQSSTYHRGGYNEVAGFRAGMIPSAIACTSDKPNEDQIRAAKYFSKLTGKDVPIIIFDIMEYDKKKKEKLEKNKEAYKNSLDISLISKIIISGCDVNVTDLNNNIDYCFGVMREKYQVGEIDIRIFIRHLSELIKTVNRLDLTVEGIKKACRKLAIYRKSILALSNASVEEIIKLENANLGESGIMYRLDSDNESYLIKPAVEKASFNYQPFRAQAQASASVLQKILSPESHVKVEAIERNGISLSKQELLEIDPNRKDYLENWAKNGGELDENIKCSLLREYVVDFLLCNFDCFAGNFVIDANGNLRGVDKEQCFRFIDEPMSLRPDFSYIPNGLSRVPLYSLLFERYRKNEITLDLSVIADTIDRAREISDEEYRKIFEKYAEQLKGDKAKEFLDKICERRRVALDKIEVFLKELDPNFTRGATL